MACRWSHGPEAGNPCGMNHHHLPSDPELADLDRVVLGPAMPGTTRHWSLSPQFGFQSYFDALALLVKA